MGTILFAIIAIVAVMKFSKWCDGQACGAEFKNWNRATDRLARKYKSDIPSWSKEIYLTRADCGSEASFQEWKKEFNELQRKWGRKEITY